MIVCLNIWVFFFYKTRSKLHTDIAVQIYHAIIYSRISYCIEIYGTAKASTIKPLQIMQNRLLKILTQRPLRYSTNMLYSELKVLKVNEFQYLLIYKYIIFTVNYLIFSSKCLIHNVLLTRPEPDRTCFHHYTSQNKIWQVTFE